MVTIIEKKGIDSCFTFSLAMVIWVFLSFTIRTFQYSSKKERRF
ncbi:hypothetical protein HX021_10395 [Sphingobacterium sp. N143]|nr:hypothetical protein [Sphingobacterium sp. N143]